MQYRAVREAIALPEAVGLDLLTDGEQRRLNFQDVFSNSVPDYAQGRTDIAFHEQRVAGAQPLRRFDFAPDEQPGPAVVQRRPVVERLRLVRTTPLEEYRFASAGATRPVKVTLIGPERIGQHCDRAGSAPVYVDLRALLADVVAIEREIVRGLVDAGGRYVHIDAPGYTAYVDAPSLAQMRARGEDPANTLAASLAADNALIAGLPGVTFGIHLCRGNQRSMWYREGSYDAIAEQLFHTRPHQRFLLEYDSDRSDRAGGFKPLRCVPKGTVVVLGLIRTKVPGDAERGRAVPADRRGGALPAPRTARHRHAVRVRLGCRRQPDHARRPAAQAGARGRGRPPRLGLRRQRRRRSSRNRMVSRQASAAAAGR